MSKAPLERYAAKRTFSRTPEPKPAAAAAREGPLLFVVQKHAARRLHYDFRLELDGVLKSWAVPKGPSSDPLDKRMAVQVEDHPFDYGSFEGEIPAKQYGAGSVIVWDCGVYSPDEGQQYAFNDRALAQERVRAELAAGKLSFFLCGEKLKGSYTLVRTAQSSQWLLIKHKDRFAHANDLLARHRSVLSGASLEEVAALKVTQSLPAARLAPAGPAEALPKQLKPMLAESGELPASDPQWRYEPKLDGYRVIAFVGGAAARLQSRRGLDLTPFFPELAAELAAQPGGQLVLDGEIVALDPAGRPSFNALQNRAQLKSAAEIAAAQRDTPVVLVCFDLLHFAGVNLRAAAYVRPAPLPRAVPRAERPPAAGAFFRRTPRNYTTRRSGLDSRASWPRNSTVPITAGSARVPGSKSRPRSRPSSSSAATRAAREPAIRWAHSCSGTTRARCCTTPDTSARAWRMRASQRCSSVPRSLNARARRLPSPRRCTGRPRG